MTKEQFLARCANAYDMGLCSDLNLNLLDSWLDAVMRFEGGQLRHWVEFLEQENKRLNGFDSRNTLANDKHWYEIIQIAAILSHHCQECATDPKAWHTRSEFCNHKKDSNVNK